MSDRVENEKGVIGILKLFAREGAWAFLGLIEEKGDLTNPPDAIKMLFVTFVDMVLEGHETDEWDWGEDLTYMAYRIRQVPAGDDRWKKWDVWKQLAIDLVEGGDGCDEK